MMSVRSTVNGERPAIFLMYNGVLCEREDPLARRPDDGALLATSIEGLRLLGQLDVSLIALAHRRSVAGEIERGGAGRAYADRVCAQIRRRGARIDALRFVPGRTAEYERARTAMARVLQRAMRAYAREITCCFFICDTWLEVEAGLTAGCQPLLVMTGSGRAEISRSQTAHVRAQTWYAADLMMAALSVDAHLKARPASRVELPGAASPGSPTHQNQPMA
jgi:D-glycero-D-manno-heptose 1,7-bisphosphate phosphatase